MLLYSFWNYRETDKLNIESLNRSGIKAMHVSHYSLAAHSPVSSSEYSNSNVQHLLTPSDHNRRRRPLRPRPLPPPLQSKHHRNPPRLSQHHRRPTPSSPLRPIRNSSPRSSRSSRRRASRWPHTHEHDMAQEKRRANHQYTESQPAVE